MASAESRLAAMQSVRGPREVDFRGHDKMVTEIVCGMESELRSVSAIA